MNKINLPAVCLIAMLTLSACNSNSSPNVSSNSVRLSGNEKCLDLEKMMANYAALPGNQPIQTQVTDIEVVAGPSDPSFEESAIRNLYESETIPQSKNNDGSVFTQSGCDAIKITYKNGRSDDYKITEFTEDSLKLVLQGGYSETTHIHRINDSTYEMKYNTNFGYCQVYAENTQIDAGTEGTVEVTETISWSNPLPTINLPPDFAAKVQAALSTPQPACPNTQR